MPSNVNGCGTKYYGRRDIQPDGSYITTNFICLLFIPLVPLHSVRVIPDPKNSSMPFSKNHYLILEKKWPNLIQVLAVYLVGAFAVGMGTIYFWKVEPYVIANYPALAQEWFKVLLFCCFIGLPVIIAVTLRNAMQKSKG